MISRKKITIGQAKEAMAKGEFGREVVNSCRHVAIILTQSWCPQWAQLDRRLKTSESLSGFDIDIYEFVYDKEEIFRDF